MVNLFHSCRLGLVGLAVLVLLAPAALAQRRTLYSSDPDAPPPSYNTPPGQPAPGTSAAYRSGTPYVGSHSGSYGVSAAPVAPIVVQTGASYGGYPGYGYPQYQSRAGSDLQGLASVTSATGQYYNQIQQARITREQSRQMSLDTQRKQIEFEMWYETVRPTAPKMVAREKATDLDWARNYAAKTEIWSGRTLNVLLGSVLTSSNPTQGPNIPLNDTALRGLNLTDGTTRANLSLTRDEGKLNWPEALQAEGFDEIRDRFSKNFASATLQAQSSGPPSRAMMNSLRADLKKLEDKLDDVVPDLAPSRYIEARRLLNQLKENIRGLSDPRLCKACHSNWRKNIKNVSDLVGYCMKNGLQFGPSIDGGEPSYTVTYYALRNYERSMVQLASR